MDKFIRTLGLLMLLGGCNLSVGKGNEDTRRDDGAASRSAASPAAGKSKEGEMSIKLPGFDMKVDLPEALSERVRSGGDNDLVYPGSVVSGIHIEGGAEKSGARESGVELRFRSGDPVEKVAAWYRDPARRDGFAITREGREDGSLVIYGTQKGGGDPFRLQLNSAGGGTDARLTLADRE